MSNKYVLCALQLNPLKYAASRLPFSSDLVRAVHARGRSEAVRRAKRGRQPEKEKKSFFLPLPSRAISHARGHLRVSHFARRTIEKRETARSLLYKGHLGDRRKWPLSRGDCCREVETRVSVGTVRQKKWSL